MVAFNYAEMLTTADELITEFGQVAAVARSSGGSGDAWNTSGGTITYYPTTAVAWEYDAGEVNGSTVLSTDRRYLVAAGPLPIEPGADDDLVVGGEPGADANTWVGGELLSVTRFSPLKPGPLALYWEAQVRE